MKLQTGTTFINVSVLATEQQTCCILSSIWVYVTLPINCSNNSSFGTAL